MLFREYSSFLLLLLVCALADSATSVTLATSSSSSATCRRELNYFVLDLNLQCPFSHPYASSPLQVDGESFGKAVSSCPTNEHLAVLFHSSRCPFSSSFAAKFSILSYLYPRIKHVMVEQSSALPSIFSMYGVHSVPSLLIVNQTMKIRYHGRKDLDSLVKFYKRNTGVDPIVDMAEEETSSSETSQNNPPGGASMGYSGEEPYLLLSIVFVSLRAVVFFFPGIASRILALWSACVSNLNVAILRESKQLVAHLLHLIDVGRIWRKVKLTKTRNFQKGAARNARVWASSLTTSVSLGETSQTRAAFPSRDL